MMEDTVLFVTTHSSMVNNFVLLMLVNFFYELFLLIVSIIELHIHVVVGLVLLLV